jgi:hypothetical protein
MKQPEYKEGPEALEKFEEGMKTLFSVSKDRVVRAEKKARGKKASSQDQSVRKPRPADKD